MMVKPGEITEVLRSVARLYGEKDISFLSAGIAFYAFFSVVPAILLTLALGSLLGGEAFAERVVSLTEIYLSSEGERVLGEALSGSVGRVGASAFGFIALTWSSLKVFRAIDTAFGVIYGGEGATSFARGVADAVVLVTVIVVGIVLLVAFRLILAHLVPGSFDSLGLAGSFFSVAALVAVLLPVYYLTPPVSVSLRSTVPGTLTTVAGWLLLQRLFSLYAENAFQYQAYGLVGAVLLFLLWLYVGATVLLLGGAVNAVVANREDQE